MDNPGFKVVEDYTKKGSIQNDIIIGMITDNQILGRIASHWDKKLFPNRFANVVAYLCIKYYKKHGKAPWVDIETSFLDWSRGKDPEEVDLIKIYLDSLSHRYTSQEQVNNPEHLLDVAGEFLRGVRVERQAELALRHLRNGEIDRAENAIISYSKLELGTGAGIELFTDEEAVKSAFIQEDNAPMIRYPGALGKFFSGGLQRSDFVAFIGRAKAGKSYWLSDLAFMAAEQGKKTAYFGLGDLSEGQIKRRFLSRLSGRPIKSTNLDESWPCIVNIPNFISSDGEGINVDSDEKLFEKPLDGDTAWEACKEKIELWGTDKSPIRMSAHPNYSISIMDVKDILDRYIREGFVPDIVVLDYADLLTPVDKREEKRDQVNTTWKYLRRFSLEYHVLMLTATQTNASGFKASKLDMSSFSEDNRKWTHVTGAVGINVTSKDKDQESVRLNWIVLRERAFSDNTFCYVAGCLPIANPAICSCFDSGPQNSFTRDRM